MCWKKAKAGKDAAAAAPAQAEATATAVAQPEHVTTTVTNEPQALASVGRPGISVWLVPALGIVAISVAGATLDARWAACVFAVLVGASVGLLTAAATASLGRAVQTSWAVGVGFVSGALVACLLGWQLIGLPFASPLPTQAASAPTVGTSLRGAVYDEMQLRGVDWSGKDAAGISLARADLEGANLTRTFLRGADLTNAILRGACLRDADLSGAIVTGTDFTGADTAGWTPPESYQAPQGPPDPLACTS